MSCRELLRSRELLVTKRTNETCVEALRFSVLCTRGIGQARLSDGGGCCRNFMRMKSITRRDLAGTIAFAEDASIA